MSTIGPTELLIILVLVLLVFGGAKIPKLARSLGQAQREFKEGVADGAKEADTSKSSSSGSARSSGTDGTDGATGANGSA